MGLGNRLGVSTSGAPDFEVHGEGIQACST